MSDTMTLSFGCKAVTISIVLDRAAAQLDVHAARGLAVGIELDRADGALGLPVGGRCT
jgi:hypothetical protein